MSCDSETREEMAAMGMTTEELDLMELQVNLAQEKAKALAYSTRMTKYQQDAIMEAAAQREREIAHDRFHRRQADESKAFFSATAKVAAHADKT